MWKWQLGLTSEKSAFWIYKGLFIDNLKFACALGTAPFMVIFVLCSIVGKCNPVVQRIQGADIRSWILAKPTHYLEIPSHDTGERTDRSHVTYSSDDNVT